MFLTSYFHAEKMLWKLLYGVIRPQVSILTMCTMPQLVISSFASSLVAVHERILKIMVLPFLKLHRTLLNISISVSHQMRLNVRTADKTCLTGTSACTYYFNPSIPEARGFHSRYESIPTKIIRASHVSALIIPSIVSLGSRILQFILSSLHKRRKQPQLRLKMSSC